MNRITRGEENKWPVGQKDTTTGRQEDRKNGRQRGQENRITRGQENKWLIEQRDRKTEQQEDRGTGG